MNGEPTDILKSVKLRRTYKKKQPIKNKIIIEPMTYKKTNSSLPRLNEKFVDLMTVLAYVMRTRKDFMRMKAYDNARDTISSFSGDITKPEQLKGQKMELFVMSLTGGSSQVIQLFPSIVSVSLFKILAKIT